MKIHQVEQGSQQWRQIRLGVATASNFSRIVTPKGKISKGETQQRYMNELLAEWILGFPVDEFTTKWVDRGTELEPQARKAYEFQRDVIVEQVGFITDDSGLVGASPDGFTVFPNGEKGGLELKCPKHSTHVGYMLGAIDDEYKPQVQGGLLVCEDRDLWEVCSYCPEMSAVIVRVLPDLPYIATLKDALTEFNDLMMARRVELEQRFGPFIRKSAEAEEEALGQLGVSDADVDMIWEHHQHSQLEAR